MKKLFQKIKSGAQTLRTTIYSQTFGDDGLLHDTRAEAYVGEAVKILIAVVIGALLLTLSYALMKDTVFSSVTKKVSDLFNYSGS